MSGGVMKVPVAELPDCYGPKPDSRNRRTPRDLQKSITLRSPADRSLRMEDQLLRRILIDPHMGVHRPVLLLIATGKRDRKPDRHGALLVTGR
jgi:hypothetical protein